MASLASLPVAYGATRPNLPHGFDVAICQAESFFDCGRQIGEQMAVKIRAAARAPSNQALVQYVTGKGEGAAVYEQAVALNQAHYPDIFEEIRGMAAGAQVGMDEL